MGKTTKSSTAKTETKTETIIAASEPVTTTEKVVKVKKEKVEKKDLKEKSEGSGKVVVFGLSPRGRPRMEGPCCVEEEIRPTAYNPS